ncbi:MAG: aminopeptidase P N-terminal domain-containing protein [Myxococcota bacterium]
MRTTSCISQAEHAERRHRLQSELGDAMAIVAGARSRRRSQDTDYVFRQDSDLHYLTGFDQPEAVAVLSRDRFLMFVQPRDPAMETWNGRRPGTQGAIETFGADDAFPIDQLPKLLPGLIENRPRLFHSFGLDKEIDEIVLAAQADLRSRVRRGIVAPTEIVSPHELIHEMRLRKSPAELAIMRDAAAISREAHQAAARLCQPGVHEYEIQAELEWIFRKRGGNGPAYASIVGAGENATILHYIENSATLADGDLVLIDAGVELASYAADVTRTYPVGGRFAGVARDVYEAVYEAQQASFAAIRPGATLESIHKAAVGKLVEALIDLGALSGDSDELIESEAYKAFYMHNTGHFLGLDVHDVGNYHVDGKPRPIEPGMCFTVEPGLYFSETNEKTPEHLRGIGVRIEDDVVMTEDGFENLTAAIPKTVDDVERWMRE